MLMGRDTMMGYLAALDFTMSRREQQAVIARFPGALQMLPHDAAPTVRRRPLDGALAARSGRRGLGAAPRRRSRHRGQLPRRLRHGPGRSRAPALRRRPRADHGRHRREFGPRRAGQRITLSHRAPRATARCRGAPGIPPGIRAWYTEAVHGDLARHQPAFPAIQDLLERGTTNLLPTTAPAAARGQGVPRSKVRDTVPMFPDAEDLAAGRHGRHAGAARPEQALPRIRIKVVHGHLAFASHPVMVGHYAGDTINGAEAELDEALDGRLDRRKQLGLYPGALGTSTVVLDRTTRPQGAIVVGLGDHADLAPGTLAETLRRGILAYAIEDDDRAARRAASRHGGPLGRHGAAGRRGRRRPADRQQHRGAAARRDGGPAARSAATACASSR